MNWKKERYNKVKKGDSVVMVCEYFAAPKDGKGIVVHIKEGPKLRGGRVIGVDFEQYISGHDCSGHCTDGYGYYVPENHIKKIE